MVNPELVNAVGGGNLNQELELRFLYDAIEAEVIRYDPEHWPGLYLRFNSESAAVLVFSSGKYNIAGAPSIEQLFDENERFLSKIRRLGINIEKTHFEVRNLVFLDRYEHELDLNQVAVALGLENAEYEPEQFPGILFRPKEQNATFMIFRNGKVILTGIDSRNNAMGAFIDLFDNLNELF